MLKTDTVWGGLDLFVPHPNGGRTGNKFSFSAFLYLLLNTVAESGLLGLPGPQE